MNEEDYNQMYNQSVIQGETLKNANISGQQYYLEEKERGLAEVQLEVDSIKEDIFHLLQQDVYKTHNGKTDWISLEDLKQRTLSDWGVDRIMQIIHFYVNKNTLLSNFSAEQIDRIMLRFMSELNDLVLLKYQNLFRHLTFEECKEVILERIENKKKLRMFAYEIIGKDFNEKEIKTKLLHEIEKNIEEEIQKVRNEKLKEKIREYGSLISQLEIIVFATLNRAWKGEERGSIRRHTNISELIGGRPQQQQKSKGGLFGWGKGY